MSSAALEPPFGSEHARLIDHLAAVLPLRTGLATILEVDESLATPAGTDDPHHDSHAALVSDLAAKLSVQRGAASILATESGHAGLVSDLSAQVRIGPGLAAILADADPALGSPSIAASINQIRAGHDHLRLELRGGHRYDHLRDASERVDRIRERLAQPGVPDGAPGVDRQSLPAALDQHHRRLVHAAATLADALTVSREPGDPNAADLPALIQASVDGVGQAWEELVRRFSPLVDQTVREFGFGPVDAADIAQFVWLRAVEHLPLVHQPAAFPGWILTTARLECVRMKRVRTHGAPIDVRGELMGIPEDKMTRAMTRLRPSEQDLLAALMADPRPSYEEISRRVGIPIGSIGPTRQRILDKLRALIHDDLMAELRAAESAVSTPDVVDQTSVVLDRSKLGHFDSLVRDIVADLDRTLDLVESLAPFDDGLRGDCLIRADRLAATVEHMVAALSDFCGADLRAASGELELADLEGVRWSTAAAEGGATRWSPALAGAVIDHSVDVGEGIFLVRVGAGI